MSLHTGTVSRPRTDIRRPMRPALRQHMYGPRIMPAYEEPTPRWHRAVIIGLALVVAVLCATKGWNW